MNETRNDNGYRQFPFRVFSLLLIAIMPAVFASSMFYACVSGKEKTIAQTEDGMPAGDKNYYYLPDYEVYYYPPNRQWIYFDNKSQKWLVSGSRPEKINKSDLKNIYVVRLDYEGFTPYELNASHKIKYPPSRRMTPKDERDKSKKRGD